MNFTKHQQLAIDIRNKNVLVSAAAGSGKTATLTERIIRLITDKGNPADINRMLIVTFTRAAAGELKTRISKKLSEAIAEDPENIHLTKQLTALAGAKISTIDSYYLDLVRSNFQLLNIPAKFRLADDTELKILRYDIMNSVLERKYQNDEEFIAFADLLTTAKGENRLAELFLDIVLKIEKLNDGTGSLTRYQDQFYVSADNDFFKSNFGCVMLSELKEELDYLIKRADHLIELIDLHPEATPYARAICNDRDHLLRLSDSFNHENYSLSRSIIFEYNPLRLDKVSTSNKNEITEEIKDERNNLKKRLTSLKEREFCIHPDDLPEICKASARFCKITKEIIDDFNSSYKSEKDIRAICEFSDLRKFALELLLDSSGSPTQVALNERKNYDHIFVDEYQDTDSTQDLVFQTISNGHNLFFVGDIKQSIYAFRGAEPSVFSAYRKEYSPITSIESASSDSVSIFMSENFRCSENIISFTNCVCSYLFRETDTDNHGIGYVSEDDLVHSRNEVTPGEKVKVVLLEDRESEFDDDDNGNDLECVYVINEIKNILATKTKSDGRPFKPNDIAILSRTNKAAQKFANALGKAGIAYSNSAGDDLFENPEVLLFISLLSAADNPHRDIPLAASLRSPIFGFTLSDLVRIRCGRREMSLFDALYDYSNVCDTEETLRNKCIHSVNLINTFRAEAESMPVHQFMRYLWKETNAISYAGSDKSTSKRTLLERRRNLQTLYEFARNFEASSYKGLHEFVEYINGIIQQGTKITAADAVTENTVQIMNIHKSKGLEFPAVFLVDCNRKQNKNEVNRPILFTSQNDLGPAFKTPDSSDFGQITTPQHQTASKQILQIASEEEIRILYVALTRARDILYILASGSSGFAEKAIESANQRSKIGGRYSVLSSVKYIDRILTALSADPLNRSYTIEIPEIFAPERKQEDQLSTPLDESKVDKAYIELKKSLEYVYPYASTLKLPAKMSVSHLSPELLNESTDDIDDYLKAANMEPRTPRFMGGTDNAAERGTATHLFLQFCDFNNLTCDADSIDNELGRLIAFKYVNQEIAALIRKEELQKFVKSDFFSEILHAKEIYRELRFNIMMPAHQFTTDKDKKCLIGSEKILVQGVIDLCFWDSNNNLVLCDYKTDRLSPEAMINKQKATEELFERHSQQLYYYSKAVEQIMEKKPDKIFIYSLAFGDALEVTF